MKTDTYLKAVLTVIAICLVILTLKSVNILPEAQAGAKTPGSSTYAMVPVGPDGTVTVKIASIEDDLSINLEKVGGYGAYSGIPVILKDR